MHSAPAAGLDGSVAAESVTHEESEQTAGIIESLFAKEELAAAAPSAELMKLEAVVHGITATALIDSGASSNFISSDFVQEWKIPTRRVEGHAIRLADGRQMSCNRVVRVRVKMGGYRDYLTLRVLPLRMACDVILGQPWLREVNPAIDWAGQEVVIRRGSKRCYRLRPTPPPQPAELLLLSSMQLHRAARKGGNCFVAFIKDAELWGDPVQSTLGAADGTAEGTATGGVGDVPEGLPPKVAAAVQDPGMHPRARQLLIAYADRFEMPKGLPPEREIQHTIELEPGHQPPCRSVYRFSPAELDELRRQLTELLDAGLIQPSKSPYGAPVLFVRKKDGSMRMCVDYRALNKITIKNKYPLPRVDDLLDRLAGAKVYSRLDLHAGFHQVRVAQADIPKTAFRCRYGSFEFRVMPFGLCNAPATFQALMQDVFREQLDETVIIFVDDIVVFSANEEDHAQHLETVLSLLRQHGLHAKLSKCAFFQRSIEVLGFVVSEGTVRIDDNKVKAVLDWPTPNDVHELRSFLGLANFFRRFVRRYAHIAAPLHRLTGTKQPWEWGEEQTRAFEKLKSVLTTAPVLLLPQRDIPYQVWVDASARQVGAVLTQDLGDGPRVIAFESRKMRAAELNYPVHDQELLAVKHALGVWKHYLEGAGPFKVYTDHASNRHFFTKPELHGRQARWAELFARFDFQIDYVKGKANVVADALSRRPDSAAQELLSCGEKLAKFDFQLCCMDGQAQLVCAALERTPEPGYLAHLLSTAVATAAPAGAAPLEHLCSLPAASSVAVGAGVVETIRELLGSDRHAEHYRADVDAGMVPEAMAFEERDGLLYRRGTARLYVPEGGELRQRLLMEHHDTPYAGHQGRERTYKALARGFYWPGMHGDVKAYVQTCLHCQRNKASNRPPLGKLQPLPVPGRPWEVVTLDFITSLPKTPRGYDAILVVVDKLTKYAHFLCTKGTATSRGTAELFFERVWAEHGLPAQLVSDRDAKFTAKFWQVLFQDLLGTKLGLSSSMHPQTDGQTERVNRALQDMLRSFVNERQTDWDKRLPAAQFAWNDHVSTATGFTPFKLATGLDPLTPPALLQGALPPATDRTSAEFVRQRQADLELAKSNLAAAAQRMREQTDAGRTPHTFHVGDKVWVSTKLLNVFRDSPGTSRKLTPKWAGPFPVVEVVNPVAVRLRLPRSCKAHDVVHASWLRPVHEDDDRFWLRATTSEPPPLWYERGAGVWYVDRIIGKRSTPARGVEYYVKWKGYALEDSTWVPAADLSELPEVIEEYESTMVPVRSSTVPRRQRSERPRTEQEASPSATAAVQAGPRRSTRRRRE